VVVRRVFLKSLTRREMINELSKGMMKKAFHAYSEFNNAANPSCQKARVNPAEHSKENLLDKVQRINQKYNPVRKEG